MVDLYANWAKVYDYFYPDRSDEVRFWARTAGSSGMHLLDGMCGTAEVSLGLARRGFSVVGLDLSPAMLSMAGERLAAAADYPAQRLSLVQGDLCSIPLHDQAIDMALVGGNGSLNHLPGEAASQALCELRRVLRPGGRLGLELLNPYLLQEIYPERTFGPFRPTPPGIWVEKTSRNHYDRDAGLFHIQQTTRYEMEGQRGEFKESFSLSVWEPAEVEAMLRECGYRDVRFFGSYDLVAFGEWSSDLLALAHTAPRHEPPA